MTSPALKRELIKLRILQFLADPARAEYGATIDGIKSGIEQIRMVNEERVLAEMVRSGLVERRPSARGDGRAKPYFVTEQGKTYLERQRDLALVPETEPGRRWSETSPGGQLRDLIADHIRRLPEFRDSGDDRISEVSRDLADAFGCFLGRPSGPHR